MNSGLETIEIPKTMKVSLRLFLLDDQNAPSDSETPKWPLGGLIRNFASTKLNKIFILFNYLYLITASPVWQEVLKILYSMPLMRFPDHTINASDISLKRISLPFFNSKNVLTIF